MLQLTRRLGEKINISDEISVLILEISGDCVRIEIVAPENAALAHEAEIERISKCCNLKRSSLAPLI